MRYRLVRELAADGVVVAVACRVLAVSTAGYYEWEERAPSARAVADQALSEQIVEIHAMSRGSYGAPWVHAELRLGQGVRCGRKRVARLMRSAGLHGIYRRRGRHARLLRAEPVEPEVVEDEQVGGEEASEDLLGRVVDAGLRHLAEVVVGRGEADGASGADG